MQHTGPSHDLTRQVIVGAVLRPEERSGEGEGRQDKNEEKDWIKNKNLNSRISVID
jgi:hypothetical protein